MMLALGLGMHRHWCRKRAADADDADFRRYYSLALVSEGAPDADGAGFGPRLV